ncbi:MAG: VOC family protein [Gammaproteobacteria bacterium]|jgi:glyoxylase I family protein
MHKINAIHHVSLVVEDTGRALAFYRDLLGIPQCARPELGFPGAWLQLGDLQIHLLELPNPDPVEGRPQHGGRDRHVAFGVSGLDEIRALLEARDVAFTLSKSGRKALFCRDPDGNAVELIEQG